MFKGIKTADKEDEIGLRVVVFGRWSSNALPTAVWSRPVDPNCGTLLAFQRPGSRWTLNFDAALLVENMSHGRPNHELLSSCRPLHVGPKWTSQKSEWNNDQDHTLLTGLYSHAVTGRLQARVRKLDLGRLCMCFFCTRVWPGKRTAPAQTAFVHGVDVR